MNKNMIFLVLVALAISLDSGAIKKSIAIQDAVWNGDHETVKKLIKIDKKLVNVIHYGLQAPLLCVAAYRGHWKCAFELITGGANMNLCSELFERSALHYAVIEKHLPVVKLLVESGADCNLKDFFKKKPSDYAVSTNQTALITYFKQVAVTRRSLPGLSPKIIKCPPDITLVFDK